MTTTPRSTDEPSWTPARALVATPRGEFSLCAWDGRTTPESPVHDRPLLHFAHATGFHGATYAPLLASLSDTFRVRAWDARGHGQSPAQATHARHARWEEHCTDLLSLIERLHHVERRRIFLAGHSMGATISYMLAAQRPDLVAGLLLLDPVVMPRFARRFGRWLGMLWRGRGWSLVQGAKRRRAHFPDVKTMFESYHQRGAFRTWEEPFLRAYLSAATRPHENGLQLACAPRYEAAIYSRGTRDPLSPAAALAVPFSLLLAEQQSSALVVKPFYASAAPSKIQVVPNSTHFLPMELPQIVREEALHLLRRSQIFFARAQNRG